MNLIRAVRIKDRSTHYVGASHSRVVPRAPRKCADAGQDRTLIILPETPPRISLQTMRGATVFPRIAANSLLDLPADRIWRRISRGRVSFIFMLNVRFVIQARDVNGHEQNTRHQKRLKASLQFSETNFRKSELRGTLSCYTTITNCPSI